MNDLVTPPARSGKSLMERLEDALLPLINLVFLLLMFFIVAGQLSDTPLPDLPDIASQAGSEQPHADLIVTGSGKWRVEGQVVSAENLGSSLPAPDENAPLRIAAGQNTAMADLEALLRLLERQGYREIILLTEPGS